MPRDGKNESGIRSGFKALPRYARILVAVVGGASTLATGVVAVQRFYFKTLGEERREYRVLSTLNVHTQIDAFSRALGPAQIVNVGRGARESIYVGKDYYVQAVSDDNDKVIVGLSPWVHHVQDVGVARPCRLGEHPISRSRWTRRDTPKVIYYSVTSRKKAFRPEFEQFASDILCQKAQCPQANLHLIQNKFSDVLQPNGIAAYAGAADYGCTEVFGGTHADNFLT